MLRGAYEAGKQDALEKIAGYNSAIAKVNVNHENVREGDFKNTLSRAERKLVKNQLSKFRFDMPIGAAIGAIAGVPLGPAGIAGGAALGGLGGTISGLVRGSRGSDAADIRNKEFGTNDFDKIKAMIRKNRNT